MYKRILVPLDGSGLAEQALPHAVAVAKACEGALELLTMVPLVIGVTMPEAGVNLAWETPLDVERDYLAGAVARLEAEGVAVTSELRRGDIAEGIIGYAQDSHADLIVMSTHGRSGLGRWVYGSIADRVLRHATVPVLLVRATEQ